jgi:hypothetical protein
MGIEPTSCLPAYVTLASSKKKEREINALIVAMLPTEEREKFYDHLSQWVRIQFGRNHCIGTLHLSLSSEEFELLQLHQNWWIRLNFPGPIERLEQLHNQEHAKGLR